MIRFFILCLIIISPVFAEEEKIIDVPSEMTVEMILANQNGIINGTHNVRARIFDPVTLERLWFENYENQSITNGSVVLTLNSVPSFNAYALHKKKLKFVVSVGSQPVEIPLLTGLYSYRSLFAEFGYDTRFPSILFIDRKKNFIGFGTQTPKAHLDIVGGIKLAYEDTNVTGAIRWEGSSLYIKHPTRWVDLLYGPSTFIKSRWSEFSNNIQLTSANFRIGIGTKFPKQKLQVVGSAYFSGDLKSTSLIAKSLKINNLVFNDSVLKPTAIHVKDGVNVMEWTKDNLRVPYGTISGDGSGLTNVGQDQKDFATQMLQTHHLDTNSIVSRNLKLQVVKADHIPSGVLKVDRMVPLIFNGDHIADNAIASNNIMIESLTFDMLITNNVTEYIQDNFFISSKIAPNSISESQLKDQGIASINIKPGIFDAQYFENNIILGSVHITPNSITLEKFATGEIKQALFSGSLSFAQGGTGITTVQSDRVTAIGSNVFNANTNLYVNSSNFVGVFGSNGLNSLQKNYPYLLTVGSLTTSVNVAVRETGSNAVKLDLINPNQTMNLSLNSDGRFSMDLGSRRLILHPAQVLSTAVSNSQEQLDLSSAITIGDATNSQPKAGTMEYEAVNQRFRFYNGSSWKVISAAGLGIGQPIAKGNQLKIDDSFVGASQFTGGSVRHSMVGESFQSDLHGQNLQLGRVIDSTVRGTQLGINFLAASRVSPNQTTLN